jgi:hypothetical protein
MPGRYYTTVYNLVTRYYKLFVQLTFSFLKKKTQQEFCPFIYINREEQCPTKQMKGA